MLYVPHLSSRLVDGDYQNADDSTPLLQDWLGDDAAKRFRREVHFPTGRFGEAVEQAYAVLFLASDESSFVNGTDFVVDGGLIKVGPVPVLSCLMLGLRDSGGCFHHSAVIIDQAITVRLVQCMNARHHDLITILTRP